MRGRSLGPPRARRGHTAGTVWSAHVDDCCIDNTPREREYNCTITLHTITERLHEEPLRDVHHGRGLDAEGIAARPNYICHDLKRLGSLTTYYD